MVALEPRGDGSVVSGRVRRLVEGLSGHPLVMWGLALAYGIGVTDASGVGCPFHRLTGLECPGCGGTRALEALCHGDLVLAVRDNAVVVVAPLLVAVHLTAGRGRFGVRRAPGVVAVRVVVVVLVLAWTVLRNTSAGQVFRPAGGGW